MHVRQITTGSESLTAPFRSTNGVTLALRWGDICHPLGKGSNADGSSWWFSPPYFEHVIRTYVPLILVLSALAAWVLVSANLLPWVAAFIPVLPEFVVPLIGLAWTLISLPLVPGVWVSYRIGNKGGYYGWKIYGADSEAYKNWMHPFEVYDGSQAMMLSIRPSATINS